jgi:hypothetical protein
VNILILREERQFAPESLSGKILSNRPLTLSLSPEAGERAGVRGNRKSVSAES